jgi:hypothetical protein
MKKVLLLVLSISLFSCSKSDDSAQALPVPSVDSIYYFNASLNGNAINYHMDNYTSPTHILGYLNGFQSNGAGNSYYFGSEMVLSPGDTSSPRINLVYENLYATANSSTVSGAFYGLFSTIPTNFITSSQNSSYIKGISIEYRPNGYGGVNYSSEYGSQSGSIINFTSSISGIESGLKTQTLIGTTTCKLYNTANPLDIINLTNGQFKLTVIEN